MVGFFLVSSCFALGQLVLCLYIYFFNLRVLSEQRQRGNTGNIESRKGTRYWILGTAKGDNYGVDILGFMTGDDLMTYDEMK